MDQHQSLKHFCRVCKKGFGCGRALGGHMRAHGIGDEHVDDEDPASDGEEKLPNSGSKRMYALRTNPNRLKSCRICENCGMEFLSWKSFLEHGKCTSDMETTLVSSPESDEDDGNVGRGCGGWSKGKRTRRMASSNSNCPSSEEEDLANCLVMLSAARVDPPIAETEESCASASKEEERRNPVTFVPRNQFPGGEKVKVVAGKGLFECKACRKVFSSHQALGGHRASHKKVKGCFAAKLDDLDESLMEEDVIHDEFLIPSQRTQQLRFNHSSSQATLMAPPKRRSKVHECSICHRVFASGQALGGHKRCHWVTSSTSDTSIAKLQPLQDQNQKQQQRQPKNNNYSEPIDLNLPAPIDDIIVNQDNQAMEPSIAAIYLLPWQGDGDEKDNKNKKRNNNNSSSNNNNNSVDDEADSKSKFRKLSDLKAMGLGGGSSPWLQVGIGSGGNGGGDP